MSDFLKGISNFMLMSAEGLYLRLNGWHKVGPDAWDPPADYPIEKTRLKRGLRQGHAINSQKQLIYKPIRDRIAKNFQDDDKGTVGNITDATIVTPIRAKTNHGVS